MAAPTDPTLNSLVVEGLKKALGGKTPKNADITRAENIWIQEIKNDIYIKEKRLKSLYVVDTAIIKQGLSRYSNPNDYGSDMTLELLNGSVTGTAQSGTASSLTLAVDETISEANILGREILITSGAGKGSISQDTSYDTTTLIAGVEPDFGVTPGASGYMVVDSYKKLRDKVPRLLTFETNQTVQGEPQDFHLADDDNVDEFTLRPVPDKTYGLKMRFYANLMTLDVDSDLMSRLYRKWRNVWVQGIFAKKLWELDDDRKKEERNEYKAMLIELLVDEMESSGEDIMQIGVDLPDLSSRV